ncbi:hypothetical protein [Paenibacillus donghaensis]|uniref:Rad50/SbcC-type AAA domain-containing protein n=1 Tax=Paenibacillus donghaensis TaxID=414771 RepID=A0A2Z2KH78_9BACL|nr:hypothetical protein [Paenibacillus donghaensis]ASA23425.1 hypothetical protein B9T62_23030 [Paenibacillus donghaensis]
MTVEGFFITELRLVGRNKRNASILFKKGLNVISGASDTGKTYIFQVINYMFGSKNEPKEIDESIGYSTIYLELQTYDGEPYTLKRDIGESTIQVYESEIDKITVLHNFLKLKARHDKKDDENLSSFLLSLINIKEMLLRKNQRGTKVAFSFRHFVGLFMINEEKIISEESPVFSGVNTNRTAEQSALKAILTGADDSHGTELEDPKIYKTRLEGKLEIVTNSLQKMRREIQSNIAKVENYNVEELNNEIERVAGTLSDNSKEMNKHMEEKKTLWTQEQEVKSRIMMLEELLERFYLLEKSYLSDLDRLQFLIEGDHYVSQLYDSNCPICNQSISYEAVQHNHNFQLDDLQAACVEEGNKLRAQLFDLKGTLNNLEEESSTRSQEVKELRQQIGLIDEYIQKQLQPVVFIAKEYLTNLIEMKKIFQEIEINERRVEEYQATQFEIMRDLNKKSQKINYVNEITQDIYEDVANEVENLLKDWNYPDLTSVSIDHEEQDLIVSGKKRANHGKGYRAILNAAFIIALLKYTKKAGLKHPGLVILDSPLTTYKERENQLTEINLNEEVPLDMKQAFFKNLSELNHIFPNVQIIILENIDPNEEVQSKMNYIHFTKIIGVGRYGFIPVDGDAGLILK